MMRFFHIEQGEPEQVVYTLVGSRTEVTEEAKRILLEFPRRLFLTHIEAQGAVGRGAYRFEIRRLALPQPQREVR